MHFRLISNLNQITLLNVKELRELIIKEYRAAFAGTFKYVGEQERDFTQFKQELATCSQHILCDYAKQLLHLEHCYLRSGMKYNREKRLRKRVNNEKY